MTVMIGSISSLWLKNRFQFSLYNIEFTYVSSRTTFLLAYSSKSHFSVMLGTFVLHSIEIAIP